MRYLSILRLKFIIITSLRLPWQTPSLSTTVGLQDFTFKNYVIIYSFKRTTRLLAMSTMQRGGYVMVGSVFKLLKKTR